MKNSDMVGKIPHGDGTWSEKFPHSRKNSDLVGIKDREGYMKALLTKLYYLSSHICPGP